MAIEIGFISVVLRREALGDISPQAQKLAHRLIRWRAEWFREDVHLLATCFMAPADIRAFGEALQVRTGLQRGRDWAVVDMFYGPCFPVDWLECRGGGPRVMGAWLAGTEPSEVSRVPKLTLTGGREVVHALGRDSIRDEKGHLEDFGTTIPSWGGTSLWSVAATAPLPDMPGPANIAWTSLDASAFDFMGWAAEDSGF